MKLKKQKNIAIIPARGGSKRLPAKNIMVLDSIPLLLHSINYAKQNMNIIDEIVVSTDNPEIKEMALKSNIRVMDRPKEISGDTATTVSALKHVLNSLNTTFDNVFLLQVTNPLRPEALLKTAYQEYLKNGSDSLMTVSRNEDKLGKIEDGRFIPFNYKIGQRSQDLEPLYVENGLLYISKASLILKDIILGTNNHPFVIEHPYAQVDIDTKADLRYAEFLIKNLLY
jgi:N-acylneuraminate cytidylyltransferase